MDISTIEITVIILLIVLLLIFIALPLYFTVRILDEDEGFPKVFLTTILLIVTFSLCVYFLPICLSFLIAILVNLFIIKAVYETSWGKAVVMWIVTIIVAIVITIVVIVVADLSIFALSGL